MDQDNWFSQAFKVMESTDLKGGKRSSQNEVNRYKHDIAQAKIMRTRPLSEGVDTTPSTSLTADDLNLGLKGLDRAQEYQRKGQLDAALKLYKLAIDLLIRYLKIHPEAIDAIDRSVVEARVNAALSDAESAKASLAAQTVLSSPKSNSKKTLSSSFQSLSSSLISALATTAKKKSPTNFSGTVKPRQRPQAQPPQVATRSSTTQNLTTHPRQSPTSSRINHQLPSSGAGDELRQSVLSEFYINVSMLQKTTWKDISGLANVKQALQETAILPLLRPDLFTGLRRPQNILLWGPPGTGKTLLVRAVAYESGSSLFVCTSSALTSKWMGDAEKMVRKLFQVAHELAPSILFLDEMDALLSSRKSDGGEHEASRRLKTEFMVQMDGITMNDDEGIGRHLLLIACTNCPWDVDSAVLRRFPRRIHVPLPDSEARRALIEYLLKKAGKHSLMTRQISTLVDRTVGFTCSDIASIASEAAFGPLRSLGGMDVIKDCTAADVRPIQLKDFESVINDTTKSVTGAQLQRYEQWQKQQAAS